MKKRMCIRLLALAMVLTLLPGVSLADEFTLTTQELAGLSALEVSPGTLTPAFDPQTPGYTVQVDSTVTSIRIRPTTMAGATVASVVADSQAPTPDGSGWYTVSLNMGQNNILIPVEGGLQYAVFVTRGDASGGGAPEVPGSIFEGSTHGDASGNVGSGDSQEGPTDEATASFDIAVEVVENGTLTVSHPSAREGETVTVTPIPHGGYRAKRVTAVDSEGNTLEAVRMGDGTWSFPMPASHVVVGATFRVEDPFTDVQAAAYYYEPVMWALDNDVTAGTTPTTFSPGEGCTRAQIITLIWKAKGSPEPESAADPFTDVKTTDYYYQAVLWAVENGITAGTTDTTFSPGDICTRAQAVTLLWNAEGQPEAGVGAGYADVAEDAYYLGAVDWAVEKGVTLGVSATAFGPRDTCTRAQIITFLYRALAH